MIQFVSTVKQTWATKQNIADSTPSKTENSKNLCIAISLYYCYNLYIVIRHGEKKDFTTVNCYHPNIFPTSLEYVISEDNSESHQLLTVIESKYLKFTVINSYSDKASSLHQFLHSPTGCPFKIPLFGWGSSSTIRESTPKKKTLVISEQVRLTPGPP